MNTASRVTLSLPRDTVDRLDEVATAERRSRSNAAAVLLDSAMRTGRKRLDELDALARETIARPGAEAGAAEAARAHLAEHRRLAGIPDSQEI